MNPTNRLTKSLLSTSIAAAMALACATAVALEDTSGQLKTYTDPITGQLKVAPKLLSQMTKEEQATLSEDEKAELKKVEDIIRKEAEKNK